MLHFQFSYNNSTYDSSVKKLHWWPSDPRDQITTELAHEMIRILPEAGVRTTEVATAALKFFDWIGRRELAAIGYLFEARIMRWRRNILHIDDNAGLILACQRCLAFIWWVHDYAGNNIECSINCKIIFNKIILTYHDDLMVIKTSEHIQLVKEGRHLRKDLYNDQRFRRWVDRHPHKESFSTLSLNFNRRTSDDWSPLMNSESFAFSISSKVGDQINRLVSRFFVP